MIKSILLYDYERDKGLEPGQAILVFEDGTTRRVRESSLYGKEEISAREPRIKKANAVRGRDARITQRREASARRSPKGKRVAVYKA